MLPHFGPRPVTAAGQMGGGFLRGLELVKTRARCWAEQID